MKQLNLTSRRHLWDHVLVFSEPGELALGWMGMIRWLGKGSETNHNSQAFICCPHWLLRKSSFKHRLKLLFVCLFKPFMYRRRERWDSARLTGLAQITHFGNGRLRTEIQVLHGVRRLWCLCQLEEYPHDSIMFFPSHFLVLRNILTWVRQSEGGSCVRKGMSLYLLATVVHGSENLNSPDINGYEFIEYLLSNSFDGPLTNLIHNFMCNYKCFIQSSYIPFFYPLFDAQYWTCYIGPS